MFLNHIFGYYKDKVKQNIMLNNPLFKRKIISIWNFETKWQYGISILWDIIWQFKEWSTKTCYMDGLSKHYAKWNKPVMKDHILYDSIYENV